MVTKFHNKCYYVYWEELLQCVVADKSVEDKYKIKFLLFISTLTWNDLMCRICAQYSVYSTVPALQIKSTHIAAVAGDAEFHQHTFFSAARGFIEKIIENWT